VGRHPELELELMQSRMTQKPMLRVEVGALGARQVQNQKGVLGRRSSARRLCEFAWVIQPRLGFLVFVSLLFVVAPLVWCGLNPQPSAVFSAGYLPFTRSTDVEKFWVDEEAQWACVGACRYFPSEGAGTKSPDESGSYMCGHVPRSIVVSPLHSCFLFSKLVGKERGHLALLRNLAFALIYT